MRIVMRIVPIALLGLMLAGCLSRGPIVTPVSGPAQTPSAWNIDKRIDRISGKPVATAYVVTVRTSYDATRDHRPAGLELRCFEDRPVVLAQFVTRIGANRSAVLEYRFDQNPGRRAKARFLPNYKGIAIEERAAVAQFVDELKSAKAMVLRVTSLFAGQSTAVFHVHGAPAAIAAAYANCPLAPERRTARSGKA